jgi:hypothetical protein
VRIGGECGQESSDVANSFGKKVQVLPLLILLCHGGFMSIKKLWLGSFTRKLSLLHCTIDDLLCR